MCCSCFVLCLCTLHSIVDPFLTPANAAPSIHWVLTAQQLSCPPTGYRRATTLSLAPRRDPSGRREDLNTLPALRLRGCAGGRVRSCNCQPAGASPMQSGTRAGSSGAEAEQLWERGKRASRSGVVAFRRRRSCPFSETQHCSGVWNSGVGHQHAPV